VGQTLAAPSVLAARGFAWEKQGENAATLSDLRGNVESDTKHPDVDEQMSSSPF
jgi:hypothetical protein